VDTGFRTPLLYSCRRLEVAWLDLRGEVKLSSRGTGFVIGFEDRPLLVTNRHVVDPVSKDAKYVGWSYGQISTIGASVTGDSASTHYFSVSGARVTFGAENADVAVIDLASGAATGDLQPDGSLVGIVNYFGSDWLRDSSYFDGSQISAGDPVFMVGHPEIGGEQSALPLLVGGMLSSDPRLRYHVPHGRSQAEDFRWAGTLSHLADRIDICQLLASDPRVYEFRRNVAAQSSVTAGGRQYARGQHHLRRDGSPKFASQVG
jgi:hypothetical protein